MSLVTIAELMPQAEREGYAIGAFNANNLEFVQAIVAAAENQRSPVIIQASQGAIKYAGLEQITAMVKTAAEKATVPVALHLDHGTDFNQVMRCIRTGFTSVMIDASKLPLAENIALVRRVVEVAHAVGVSVEAELGRIGGTEEHITVSEREAFFTDPEEAEAFVHATGVDTLAVAIGTAHGPYKGEPKLDFERLSEIRARVKIPIVLHGSSGVPDDAIRRAVALGVRKINIDTDLRQGFMARLREVMAEHPEEYDPRKLLGPARDALQKIIEYKMQVFGSAGRV
ncbi:MAG: fructose-bisphosphate aldolase, class [Bacillota bacterium]|jgi:fructose-bisphosphate aldolase class II|nr:fructose-bisphosphate aldolase, class [Bacillota bacterium]MDK2855444.1 fructose-bisphosphate aldolase, class [Bacillota bacterium]MDK2925345.1 fructose-bisphosphate aldolase, class [Bacillota bacterium]